ncbi:MAG: pseudouridine synthase [Lachnospiraceae bacterium]|nr:pseudouridine synthase [Lachnospiraceae bacterium]
MGQEIVRINKFLSEAGICSRRGADRLVEEGRVLIDGKNAVLGDQVLPGQKVTVDGKAIHRENDKVLLAFHKPRGIVCTAEKREKNNVIDYIKYPKRIYPVGRLDKDSEGLLLMTNDGNLGNEILKARNYHEKEYEVTVNRPVTEEFLRKMAEGVPILDTVTRKCVVEKLEKRKFRIILTQGLNRQIRRMCEYLGYRVIRLVRVRIMNIELKDIPVGKYREITHQEWVELESELDHRHTAKENEDGVFEKNRGIEKGN